MLVKTYGAALQGVHAMLITLEVNTVEGLRFYLVGLPDNAVKESERRIESALLESGYRKPGKKITINMAPADVRKEGAAYDLPIAVGILASSGQVPSERLDQCLMMGELSLDGSLRPVRGVLPMALLAKERGFRYLLLPEVNAAEASVVDGIEVLGAAHLVDVLDWLKGIKDLPKGKGKEPLPEGATQGRPDFAEVRGQEGIKRALEIAAAGSHNVLLIGPPGSGKTMLARRMPGILPPMSLEESLETTKIHSVSGAKTVHGLMDQRPFRAPHHTISDVALVGGGTHPMPGEISLAHNGVLFLDELPEFKRAVLEVLRQPLEDREVSISRARLKVTFPAGFMLIAAMNPCPCGYYNHPERSCSCSEQAVERYVSRISGPLLDRMDLHVEVVPVDLESLRKKPSSEGSQEVRTRVVQARQRQQYRFRDLKGVHANAQMPPGMVREVCKLNDSAGQMLEHAMKRLQLSARAYDRILKVSRTIADLDESPTVEARHLAEAIQYRSLDRSGWGKQKAKPATL